MAEMAEASKKQVTKRIFSSYFGRFVHSSKNEDLKEEENLRSKRRADRKQKVRSLIVVDITSGTSNDTVGNVGDDGENKFGDFNLPKGSTKTNGNDGNTTNDDLGRIASTESSRESTSGETLYSSDSQIENQEYLDGKTGMNHDSLEDQSQGEELYQSNGRYDTKVFTNTGKADDNQEQVVDKSNYEGIMQSNKSIKRSCHPSISLEQLDVSPKSAKTEFKGSEQANNHSRYVEGTFLQMQNNQEEIHDAVDAARKVNTQISGFDQFLHQLCDSNNDEIVELRRDQHTRNDEELRPSDDRKTYLKVTDQYFEDVDVLHFAKVFRERLTEGIDSITKQLEIFNNKLDHQDLCNHLPTKYPQSTRNYCIDDKSKVCFDDERDTIQRQPQNTFVPGKRQSDV